MKLSPLVLPVRGTILTGNHAGFLVRNPEASLPELAYVGEEWAYPEYKVGIHAHPGYELHLQLSGASEWTINGVAVAVPAGSLIVVAPGERHLMCSRSTHSQHFIYVGIDLFGALERHRFPVETLGSRTSFLISEAKAFEAPFTSLSHEVAENRPHRRELLELAFKTILHLILREAEQVKNEAARYESTLDNNLVFRIKRYLHNHVSSKVSVDEMAKELNVSRSMIFLTAKKELGMTPLLYHTRLRVELAKEMLHMPMMPLTTIAIDLGFSSSQHFSSVFRKMEGVAPSEYRKSLMRAG